LGAVCAAAVAGGWGVLSRDWGGVTWVPAGSRVAVDSRVIQANPSKSKLIKVDKGQGSPRRHEDAKGVGVAVIDQGQSRLVKADQGEGRALGLEPAGQPPSPPSESAAAAAHSKTQATCGKQTRGGAIKADQGGSRWARARRGTSALPLAPRERRCSRRDAGNDGLDARATHAEATARYNFKGFFRGDQGGSRLVKASREGWRGVGKLAGFSRVIRVNPGESGLSGWRGWLRYVVGGVQPRGGRVVQLVRL
jgi:hypothetical protein